MSIIKVITYSPSYKQDWDDFVGRAKNATFLFSRDFMEYHSDRFEDHSLMVFKNEKLMALFPANRSGNSVCSHQGLTYGGLVINSKTKLSSIIDIFRQILLFLEREKVDSVEIKMLPHIYANSPSDELQYVMFLCGAELYRRDCLAVVDLSKGPILSKGRKEGVKRGQKNELEIKEAGELSEFWNELLTPLLWDKHRKKSIHTLEEITDLKKKFPENIRQFNVYAGGKIVAGTTVFEAKNVAHSQYIAANSDKNKLGSLDFLHDHLMRTVFASKRYFDFGISNEAHGKKLNQGLSYWKESFGAHTVTQDFYRVSTANGRKLNDVLL